MRMNSHAALKLCPKVELAILSYLLYKAAHFGTGLCVSGN